MKRDWRQARAKVADEDFRCRVCGSSWQVESAHLVHRSRLGGMEADLIIPLCGPATDRDTCHGKLDRGELDILPHLSKDEQAAAVKVEGLLVSFYRLTGNAKMLHGPLENAA